LFLENLKTIALNVGILYLIAGVGFIADKTKIFPKDSAKKVIDLLFNIILPIAIIHTFINMEYTARVYLLHFYVLLQRIYSELLLQELHSESATVRLKEVFIVMQPFCQMRHFWRCLSRKAL